MITTYRLDHQSRGFCTKSLGHSFLGLRRGEVLHFLSALQIIFSNDLFSIYFSKFLCFLLFDCCPVFFGVQKGTVNQMYYFIIIIFKKDWFMYW